MLFHLLSGTLSAAYQGQQFAPTAQTPSQVIIVHVTAERTNRAVHGATVVASVLGGGASDTAFTDAHGDAQVRGRGGAAYAIEVGAPGFATVSPVDQSWRAGDTVAVQLREPDSHSLNYRGSWAIDVATRAADWASVCDVRRSATAEWIARQNLAASAAARNASPQYWRALVCSRGVPFTSAVQVPANASSLRLALSAAESAYALDPGNDSSLQLLALSVANRATWNRAHCMLSPMVMRVALTDSSYLGYFPNPSYAPAAQQLYRAVQAGRGTPRVLQSCTSAMITLQRFAEARDCSERALAAGFDSTWHLLRIAWMSYVDDDRTSGAAAFKRALQSAHDLPARAQVGWHFEPTRFHESNTCGRNDADSTMWDAIRHDRAVWLSLAVDTLIPWVHSRRGTMGVPGFWNPVDTNLAAHFRRLTYTGAAFRECTSRDSVFPCRGLTARRGPTVLARRALLWDEARELRALYAVQFSHLPEKVDSVPWEVELRSWGNGSSAGMPDNVMVNKGTELMYHIGPIGFAPNWSVLTRDSTAAIDGVFGTTQMADDAGPFRMSDLLIGAAGDTVRFGREVIHASANMTFQRTAPVHLFYQVRTSAPVDAAATEMSLRRLDKHDTPRDAALRITTRSALGIGVSSFDRELDLHRIKPGNYLLQVRIRAAEVGDVVRSAVITVE